jgi:hypothetical protein
MGCKDICFFCKNNFFEKYFLQNKKIKSIDVRGNTALKSLSCTFNRLTSLDLSSNTKLYRLSCYNNRLTSLDVSKNILLEWLYFGNNRLKYLDVSKNTELVLIHCEKNRLISLDAGNNTKLRVLNCRDNRLKSLDLSNNKKLQELKIQNNRFNAVALNRLFETLHDKNWGDYEKIIYIANNPGTNRCDTTIATRKGWTVNTTATEQKFYRKMKKFRFKKEIEIDIEIEIEIEPVTFELFDTEYYDDETWEEEDDDDEMLLYVIVDTKPMFNGKDADTAFREYVDQNFKYPEELYESDITGRIVADFVIKKDGSIGDVKIVRGLHPLLDAELVRVISESPKWSPGIHNGKVVNVRYQFPFNYLNEIMRREQ